MGDSISFNELGYLSNVTNAKLTYTEVYESIATCGRVLIYRLSPASSRVKFLNFWREIQIFFFVIVIYIYVSGFAV